MDSDSLPTPPTTIWGEKPSEAPGTENQLFFEDNFDPHRDKPEFKKLNDSSEYLAVLESKLAKIKNDPGVLEQLTEKREQCMRNLMDGSAGIDSGSQISLDQPLGGGDESRANDLLRRINPQQPLSVGEVVPIVKHDQLQKRVDAASEEEEEVEDNVSR